MQTKTLSILISIMLVSFSFSQTFAQLEEIIIERIIVGSTVLDIEILDGKVYVSNPQDGTIVVIDGNTNKVIDTIEAVPSVGILEIVKEKNKIYATALNSPLVYVFNLETGEKLKEIDIGEANVTLYSKADKPYGEREYITFDTNAIGLAYNPNTELLYAVHSTVNHVNIVDTNTDTNIGDISVGRTPLLIEIDKIRDIAYVTNWETNDVSVIDLKSNKEIKRLATGFIPDQLAIDQANPFMVAIDSENDKLYAANIASGTLLAVDLKQEEISLELGKSSEPTQTTEGGCLIATAAYGSELAHKVQLLREIRDNTLLSTTSGATFMTGFNEIYYSFSPTIADWERENPAFKESVKAFITPMITTLSIMTLAEQGSEEQVLGLGISIIALNLGMYVVGPTIAIMKMKTIFKKKS